MDRRTLEIAIADFGIGNVGSLASALEHLGAKVIITSNGQELVEADGMVLPGNGAFGASKQAMERLSILRWVGQRVAGGRPVLGIGVGHQVLFERSAEFSSHEGMSEWPGIVELLPTHTVPHVGWSTVRPVKTSVIFAGLADQRFYFSHSYAVLDWTFDQAIQNMSPPQVSWAAYGRDFIAAVENGPLTGLQFHPELSGQPGIQLLDNWLGTL